MWEFPPLESLTNEPDLIALGADLEPQTLLKAYSSGYFPMPFEEDQLGWFSPNPRGILKLEKFKQSRSLTQSAKKYTVTFNQAFTKVIRLCADPRRPQGWINSEFIAAYTKMHQLGWAHSVEVWHDEELVGGLYGLGFNNFFAGESMFHNSRDASKVALLRLVETLREINGFNFIDVQWLTNHLASLGCEEVPRLSYQELLAETSNSDLKKICFPTQ